MTEAGAEGQDSPSNQKLSKKIQQFSSKHRTKILLGIPALGLVGFVIFCAVSPPERIGWTGFKQDEEITSAIKTGATGQETTTTTKKVSGKTLWDWMSLILAPVTLTGLGFWFQYNQDKARADREEDDKKLAAKREEDDKKLAAENQREQALETYLDRISDILLSQQLFSLSLDLENLKEKAKLDTALDVIRARTLVILQRFNIDKDNVDGKRKRSVLLFLYDAELIGKPEPSEDPGSGEADQSKTGQTNQRLLRLEDADLHGADLSYANLISADLSSSNLSDANLISADLSGAKLINADLRFAKLISANLISADLSGAKLINADLSDANLSSANLRFAKLINADLRFAKLISANLSFANLSAAKNLTEAQLTEAKLCRTKLPSDIGLDPNRDCEELGKELGIEV